ncbi:MAG: hypothetical protein CVV23_06340 [Ignavibacteriae bacterium HGW-Ignavibacteriae-2]|jgi:hypothetical protein|nr:MAG: hypothetical protein CVV23_06340 [Ignavibacteriae bacterium HGW-Ignavibacteriae-2]
MALKIPEKSNVKSESSKSHSGLRVNYLIIFLSGLVILIGGILVFLLIIKNVYGNYEIEEILPTRENLRQLAFEEKAAILYSRYTENRLPEGETWVQDNINTWESYLGIFKMKYDVISDIDLEKGKHFNYKILILPGTFSLSDREIIQIKKFLDDGGSVFATGGPATYSDEGKWRGWDFFTECFGLRFIKELKLEDQSKIHTLRGNLPITADIPTGYTLKIATWDRPIYAEVLEPRTTQISFWYNYRKEKGLVREEIKKSAGSAYGFYGKGRFVWFGFNLNSVIGERDDFIYFEKLIKNSVHWLTYRPTSFIKDWPEPYVAAAIIIPVVGNEIGNVYNSTKLFSRIGYDPTVFVDANLYLDNPGVYKNLRANKQLGLISDIGFLESAKDTVNKLDDKTTQFSNLKKSKDSTEAISGAKVRGFMPYYGFYNEFTLQAMAKAGYEFLITDSLIGRSVPKIEIRENKPIMIINKTARDDYDIIRKYGLTDKRFQEYTYKEDIDRLIFEGGLYVLKVHTDGQLLSNYSDVIDALVKHMRKNNIWLTTVPELQTWWRQKGGIEVRYETRSKRRVTVEVSNPRDTDMTDFVVQVNLNKKIKDIEISAEIINTKLPKYRFDDSTNILYLFIDQLKSGETRIYLVDFKNVAV